MRENSEVVMKFTQIPLYHIYIYVLNPMENPTKPPFSYGFPMVFLWFSYGFPMVFLWFSYGFVLLGCYLCDDHPSTWCDQPAPWKQTRTLVALYPVVPGQKKVVVHGKWRFVWEWKSFSGGLPFHIWVCLKIVYPEKPNGFADHYPYEKWLFHWGYTPFSDIPIYWYGFFLRWCFCFAFLGMNFLSSWS